MTQANIWLVVGILLIIAEMLTTTIFLIFVALGCFSAALVEIWKPGQLPIELGVCAVITVLGATFLRKPLQRRLLQNISLKADIGQELKLDAPIAPHQSARVNYQGTTWQATNISAAELKAGDRAIVVGIDGLTLLVRKSD
jgi:membrane protein implicated in regulation of membrane protease activity